MEGRARVSARRGLRLRESPGRGDVVEVLPLGTEVEVLERETWLRVRAGDEIGFVRADYLEPVPESPAATPSSDDVASIRPFSGDRFVGEPVLADADFVPALERLDAYAKETDVEIYVTSSFRQPSEPLSGAIVEPARMSNHLVGHAIDMNLRAAGAHFNSAVLRRGNLANLPAAVRAFIERVRSDPDLRWGGDFRQEDPVHIDDGLNHSDPDRWTEKLRTL